MSEGMAQQRSGPGTKRTPFLGGFGVGRSLNSQDSMLVNLFLEMVDTRDGKAPGYFQMAPGLTYVTTVGPGPIRAGGLEVMGGILYVVSGDEVWTVNQQLVATLQGTIGTSSTPVSIINNGTQLAIFDGVNGYLAPAGRSLLSATIGSGGTAATVGDVLTMGNVGGTQIASTTVTVTALADSLSGGVIGGSMSGYNIGDSTTL